jgi:hypothetical protein
LLRLAGARAGHGLPHRQLCHQIEDAAPASGRIGEDFLVEPFNRINVKPFGPGGEKQPRKIREERFDERFETLVVIHGRRSSLILSQVNYRESADAGKRNRAACSS